jgi:hypothetical protein
MTDKGPGILTEINVTEQDIDDIISCLDPQKASGSDDIYHISLVYKLGLQFRHGQMPYLHHKASMTKESDFQKH